MGKFYQYLTLALVASIVFQVDGQSYNCHKGALATQTLCTATSSSSYYFWSGYWGPQFAIDQQVSFWNVYFFHSHYEAYPFLFITMTNASPNGLTDVVSVTMRTRCDAKQWWHYQNIEVRCDAATFTATPGIPITGGTLCTNLAYSYIPTCGIAAANCAATITAPGFCTVQQKTLDSHGGGWGEHSSVAQYFLMVNELEFR